MEKIFILQLILSFFAGGIIVAILSLIAEKASEKISGIIISLPSTVAISLFFIGWALGPQKVGELAKVIPATIGVIMLFVITYLYSARLFAKKKLPKLLQIFLSLILGLLVWFIFAVPLAIFELSTLSLSLAIYAILTLISFYFVTIKPHKTPSQKAIKYSKSQILFRAGFAGAIVTLAVFLSKTLGPFWGGIFSAFPAVYTSTLTLLHWYYDSDFLFKVWKHVPIGTISFMAYPLTCIYSFPRFGIWLGSLVAYLVSLSVFYFTKKFQER